MVCLNEFSPLRKYDIHEIFHFGNTEKGFSSHFVKTDIFAV
ncbi:hypothetical protein DA2_0967 [Desulfovibrio sp. A2]|nr:hypothetical protein DA2_0967 [Desulfovibrio sp. A2]